MKVTYCYTYPATKLSHLHTIDYLVVRQDMPVRLYKKKVPSYGDYLAVRRLRGANNRNDGHSDRQARQDCVKSSVTGKPECAVTAVTALNG